MDGVSSERQNVRIIQAPTSGNSSQPNPYLLSSQEEKDTRELHGRWRDKLRVPRRPLWNKVMTARELERSERDSFLDWRRGLAECVSLFLLLYSVVDSKADVEFDFQTSPRTGSPTRTPCSSLPSSAISRSGVSSGEFSSDLISSSRSWTVETPSPSAAPTWTSTCPPWTPKDDRSERVSREAERGEVYS